MSAISIVGIIWAICWLCSLTILGYFEYHGAVGWADIGSVFLPPSVLFSPLVLLVLVFSCPQWHSESRARREETAEADYQETLRLIDWVPSERRPIDDIEEELRVR